MKLKHEEEGESQVLYGPKGNQIHQSKYPQKQIIFCCQCDFWLVWHFESNVRTKYYTNSEMHQKYSKHTNLSHFRLQRNTSERYFALFCSPRNQPSVSQYNQSNTLMETNYYEIVREERRMFFVSDDFALASAPANIPLPWLTKIVDRSQPIVISPQHKVQIAAGERTTNSLVRSKPKLLTKLFSTPPTSSSPRISFLSTITWSANIVLRPKTKSWFWVLPRSCTMTTVWSLRLSRNHLLKCLWVTMRTKPAAATLT